MELWCDPMINYSKNAYDLGRKTISPSTHTLLFEKTRLPVYSFTNPQMAGCYGNCFAELTSR